MCLYVGNASCLLGLVLLLITVVHLLFTIVSLLTLTLTLTHIKTHSHQHAITSTRTHMKTSSPTSAQQHTPTAVSTPVTTPFSYHLNHTCHPSVLLRYVLECHIEGSDNPSDIQAAPNTQTDVEQMSKYDTGSNTRTPIGNSNKHMKTTDEIRLRETHTKQSRQDITYLKVADITSRSSATAWTPHNLNIGWIFLIRYYRSEVRSREWIRDMCSCDIVICSTAVHVA